MVAIVVARCSVSQSTSSPPPPPSFGGRLLISLLLIQFTSKNGVDKGTRPPDPSTRNPPLSRALSFHHDSNCFASASEMSASPFPNSRELPGSNFLSKVVVFHRPSPSSLRSFLFQSSCRLTFGLLSCRDQIIRFLSTTRTAIIAGPYYLHFEEKKRVAAPISAPPISPSWHDESDGSFNSRLNDH